MFVTMSAFQQAGNPSIATKHSCQTEFFKYSSWNSKKKKVNTLLSQTELNKSFFPKTYAPSTKFPLQGLALAQNLTLTNWVPGNILFSFLFFFCHSVNQTPFGGGGREEEEREDGLRGTLSNLIWKKKKKKDAWKPFLAGACENLHFQGGRCRVPTIFLALLAAAVFTQIHWDGQERVGGGGVHLPAGLPPKKEEGKKE